MADSIRIQGARENNLCNVNLTIPRNKLVVFTGLSGSGKSSLAFDTLYAEGQRRYVESLSSYARQFLGQMQKPDVDSIEGLSPAIAIDQKTTSRNPRSTVGTVTEIHDYLRLLYARAGIPHCPKCGREIRQQSVDQMADQILSWPEGGRIQVLAPLARGKKGEYVKVFEDLARDGFVRVRVDGEIKDLGEPIALDKKKKHTIEVVVDRLVVRDGVRGRLSSSLETALGLSGGLVIVTGGPEGDQLFSQNYACPACGISMEEPQPRLFSFNSPFGACPHCTGLGKLMTVDPDVVLPDRSKSLAQGAVHASGWSNVGEGMAAMYFKALGKLYGFDLDTPIEQMSEDAVHALLYGTKGQKLTMQYEREYGSGSFSAAFEGIIPNLERRYRETTSDGVKQEIEAYMSPVVCPVCGGRRLKPEALAVTVGDMDIATLSSLPIAQARNALRGLELDERRAQIAEQILKEIDARMGFLIDVGLGYLTLAREAGSLSGGEAQRIRLATQIGSALVGVLYILDEPSIGLHQRDNGRLLKTLGNLRDLGNTVVVVEHDEETMYAADHIVDVGPGAGIHGGHIVAQGTVEQIKACPESVTGQYLSGARSIPVPDKRRPCDGRYIRVIGATEHNLKNIDVSFPVGLLTCVTGVSGSGKSTLVNHILLKSLAHQLNRAATKPGKHTAIEGVEYLDKVIDIDQSPIGRTPRSNPATYTGVFNLIRDVFAATPDAKVRGYNSGRFSFNIKGGRCESCKGDGILCIEMHFLPDVYVPCEVCGGKRYNHETLQVKYKGKTIADVLDMRVEEARDFFASIPRIKTMLDTLCDVGLGYIQLGQPSTTLSGGEAQRVKLATELARRSTGRTLYILDEPTTGLHMADVHKLVGILQRLCEGGNTVVVIEHNLDIIKGADYIIDLGPEGGDGGGMVVACGTPEQVADNPASFTGQYLKPILSQQRKK
nr:excinuclease ABC subunit UvrA [bacterium]